MEPAFVMSVICIFFLLSTGHGVHGRRQDDEEIERRLKVLNKPAVTTIKTDYGDIFDCVDIHQQPGFDHPLLKNHKLQTKPSFLRSQVAVAPSDAHTSMIGLKGVGCPFGTVPIRRTSKHELVTAKHLFTQHKKYQPSFFEPQQESTGTTINAYTGVDGGKFYGARASINLWAHQLERDEWTSISTYVSNLPNSVAAGWMVNPSLFGDSLTRLYTTWSSDNTDDTGCFNLLCSGFVQVDTTIPLGVTFWNMSVAGGPQFQFDIEISKDIGTIGHWWLFVGGTAVGYWPNELMPQLQQYANQISWGGTAETFAGSKYAPPMGSGFPARMNFRHACYIRNLKLMDYFAAWYDPETDFGIYRTPQHAGCYSIEDYLSDDESWRHYVYVGGPKCLLSGGERPDPPPCPKCGRLHSVQSPPKP